MGSDADSCAGGRSGGGGGVPRTGANAWFADELSRRSLPLGSPGVDSVGEANPAKDDRVHEQCPIRRDSVARQVGVALLLRSPNADGLPGPLASPPHHPRALSTDGRIREEQ